MQSPDKKWVIGISLLFLTVLPVMAERNPFARPGFLLSESGTEQTVTKEPTAVEQLAKLKLTGIIADRIALINHQFYRIGDEIETMTVKEILSDRVILESNGQEFTLMLNIHLIKQTKRGDI